MALSIEKRFSVDLDKPLNVQYGGGLMFTGDAGADTFEITLYKSGEAYAPGGSVALNCIRADGNTVTVAGSISGNVATATLTQACCAIPGPLSVVMQIISGGNTGAIFAAAYTVMPAQTGEPIDPGTTIPDIAALIAQIDAAVDSIPADYSDLLSAIAPTFSASTAYAAGDYVWYDGDLYKFIAAHSAGSWTGSDVVAAVFATDIAELKSALTNVESAIFEEGNALDLSEYGFNNNNAVTDNGDGTYTFGTSDYGRTLWKTTKALPAGTYTLQGVPAGAVNTWIIVSTDDSWGNRIADNATASSKTFTNPTSQVLYYGVRANSKPLSAYTLEPKILLQQSRIIAVDSTLTKSGDAADAKQTGNAIRPVTEYAKDGNRFCVKQSSNGYIANDGTLTNATSAKEITSDYIPAEANNIVTVQSWATVGVSGAIWFSVSAYNSSKVFILRDAYQGTTGDEYFCKAITLPANTKYIRVSARMYDDGRIMVSNGSFVADYMPCALDIATDKGLTAVKNDLAVLENSVKEAAGLFNPMLRPAAPRFVMHRGYNTEAPENTVPAFTLAGQAGAWGIETDVYETTDGYFILSHDDDVSRMTDGTGKITEMTYAETQECTIDAGANVGEYSNLKMPTLEEYLAICRRYGCVAFIEIKGITHYDNFVAAVENAGMAGSCVFMFYYDAAEIATMRLLTSAPIALLASTSAGVEELLDEAPDYTDAWIAIYVNTISDEIIESAHAQNLPVAGWTYSNTTSAENAVLAGLDIVIADGIAKLS